MLRRYAVNRSSGAVFADPVHLSSSSWLEHLRLLHPGLWPEWKEFCLHASKPFLLWPFAYWLRFLLIIIDRLRSVAYCIVLVNGINSFQFKTYKLYDRGLFTAMMVLTLDFMTWKRWNYCFCMKWHPAFLLSPEVFDRKYIQRFFFSSSFQSVAPVCWLS